MATEFVTNVKGSQGVQGPIGPIGLPGVNAVANDTATAGYISTPAASETKTALKDYLQAKRGGLSVRDYGAVGDGIVDDTAAIQACIDAAGANGLVLFPAGFFKTSASLLLLNGTELRGAGMKVTELRNTVDVPTIKIVGGQSQAVRDIKLRHSLLARTSFDIDVTNPTRTVFVDVEIDLANASTGAGGIYFHYDSGIAGNPYMPILDRVWIRNGFLKSDLVTDGKVSNCFFWGPTGGGQPGTVTLTNGANGWTFTGNDVVAVRPTGAAYHVNATLHTTILGGYCDGGPTGIHAVSSAWMIVVGVWFHHMGRWGVRLENSHGCMFSSLMFDRCNQDNASYPDIYVTTSRENRFLGSIHSQSVVNSNPGAIYVDDGASPNNTFDAATIDLASGNNYPSPLFVGDAAAMGRNLAPRVLWPRGASVPMVLQPPACASFSATAVAWPAANTALFHRFTVTDAGLYRYANVYVDAAVGSVQASIVKMDGLNWTRVCSSGAISAVVGAMAIDMAGGAFLATGDYALVLVSNNVGTTTRILSNESLRATRQVAEVTSGAFLGTSGTISAWNGSRAVTGMTLSA